MKLTNEIRRAITFSILNHRFKAEETTLSAALKKAGAAVYEALYSGPEKALLDSAPAGAFALRDAITLDLPRSYCRVAFSKALPVFAAHIHPFAMSKHAEAELKAYDAADRALDAHLAARRSARSEIMGILHSVSTVAKLRKAWPEIEAFIPPEARAGTSMVVVPDKLNKALGLPPKPAHTETPSDNRSAK